LLVGPPAASASYHLMSVREVATNPAGADSAYIELQMYASGQNFVGGHSVSFYTGTGTLLTKLDIPAAGDVPNGQNQRTVLIGDTAAPGTPDISYPVLGDAVQTYGTGGAACWDTIDCVSWGNFTGNASLPSSAGTPAAAIPDGQALRRSIAPGCATLLESGDDTNNSSADFALTAPGPRNNSVTPTEEACGGGGGGGDNQAPETTITKAPKPKTTKTTAKFRFKSSEPNSTFQCKLDKGAFRKCDTGKMTYKHLEPGKHKFQVKATDAAGNTDSSAAKAKFKIVGD
jgi:hypothetical protein